MDFVASIKERLSKFRSEDKEYLKTNYNYEIFQKHSITDEEVNFLFDKKKIIKIYPDIAFSDRIDVEINAAKGRTIKIIFTFEPEKDGKKLKGKIGIITAFPI